MRSFIYIMTVIFMFGTVSAETMKGKFYKLADREIYLFNKGVNEMIAEIDLEKDDFNYAIGVGNSESGDQNEALKNAENNAKTMLLQQKFTRIQSLFKVEGEQGAFKSIYLTKLNSTKDIKYTVFKKMMSKSGKTAVVVLYSKEKPNKRDLLETSKLYQEKKGAVLTKSLSLMSGDNIYSFDWDNFEANQPEFHSASVYNPSNVKINNEMLSKGACSLWLPARSFMASRSPGFITAVGYTKLDKGMTFDAAYSEAVVKALTNISFRFNKDMKAAYKAFMTDAKYPEKLGKEQVNVRSIADWRVVGVWVSGCRGLYVKVKADIKKIRK